MSNILPSHIIQEIKDRSDIGQIIGEFIQLKRTGSDYTALCPFHDEKTPSFKVSTSKKLWHCFGCGTGGDIIKFLMKFNNMTFFEAVRFLADRLGIVIQTDNLKEKPTELSNYIRIIETIVSLYHKKLLEKNNIKDYFLKERKLTIDMINKFKLGYAPASWDRLSNYLKNKAYNIDKLVDYGILNKKNDKVYDKFRDRIMFPIYDEIDRPLGFGGRIIDENSEYNKNLGKYINLSENKFFKKNKILYGLNLTKNFIKSEDSIIILEGYMDVIKCYQYGIKNIAAVLGTAFTENHIKLIKRYTQNISLLFDNDTAGLNASLRIAGLLLKNDLNPKFIILSSDNSKKIDPDMYLEEYGIEAFQECIDNSKDIIDFYFYVHKDKNWLEANNRNKAFGDLFELLSKIENEVVLTTYLEKLRIKFNLNSYEMISKKLDEYKYKKNKYKKTDEESITDISDTIHPDVKKILSLYFLVNDDYERIRRYYTAINSLKPTERDFFEFIIKNKVPASKMVEEKYLNDKYEEIISFYTKFIIENENYDKNTLIDDIEISLEKNVLESEIDKLRQEQELYLNNNNIEKAGVIGKEITKKLLLLQKSEQKT